MQHGRLRTKHIPVLALILFWLGVQISFIVIGGNSIGGDAWAYAKSAHVFCETGRLMIPDRSPQSLIFLTVWGGVFAKIFGFSFVTLNAAALTLNIVGIVFFVLLLREINIEASMVLPLAVYLFNPIFFAVAGGYLTDAPFLSLLLIAMYSFVRAYRRESAAWALLGSLFTACAFLVRQYGVLLALAAVVPFLTSKTRLPRRKRAALILSTLAPTLITMVLFFLWLKFKHGVPSEFRVFQLQLLNIPRILWSVPGVPFFGGLYMGFFLSPLLLGRVFARSREGKGLWAFYSLLFASIVLILAARGQPLPFGWNNVMPYWGNTFNPPAGRAFWLIITAWCVIGAGALFAKLTAWLLSTFRSLVSTWDEVRRLRALSNVRKSLCGVLTILLLLASGLMRRPSIKVGEWIITWIYHTLGGATGRHTFTLSYWINQVPILYDQVITAIALILVLAAISLLCGYFVIKTERSKLKQIEVSSQIAWTPHSHQMLIAFLVFSVTFLIVFWTHFDRYLLILLPPAILLPYADRGRAGSKTLSIVIMILLAALAVGNAHVGMQLSKAMWDGGQYLLAQGVLPERIRGSIGFNAWYLYDQRGTRKPDDPPEWWVIGDDYVVDVKLWPGYEVIKRLPYWNCFKLSKEAVYVMRRVKAGDEQE